MFISTVIAKEHTSNGNVNGNGNTIRNHKSNYYIKYRRCCMLHQNYVNIGKSKSRQRCRQ